MNVIDHPVLVLNNNWMVDTVIPAREAVSLLLSGSVYPLVDYVDRVIRSPSVSIRVPAVLVRRRHVQRRRIRLTRRNLFSRDAYTCQYCGVRPRDRKGQPVAEGLTWDHVVPRTQAKEGWEPDTWIWDDQAVVIHVRGRGLVVLSSCSHSGVINVLHHARRITGVDEIHGFVGGFHLTGGLFEPIIPRTIDEIVSLSPDVVVPGHCTGWKALHTVAAAVPEAFSSSNVGTTFRFFATDEAAT